MSIISTSANYGGKISDYQQNIKQFVVSGPSEAIWVYKRLPDGLLVQTPANQKIPVLITSDLVITGSLYNTSDVRLKENITEISTAKMDDLFTLNPVIFNYKNDQTKKTHYGVLAQDVEKVFPELVEDNMSGYKTVNYQELLPLMLAKMKNMQEQIDELKEKENLKENI
jgi:cell shape-determining protein MreC